MIRVMLVDDQPMMRAGLRMVLESEDDLQVVAEANNGEEAISLYPSAQPDVVLMDVQMPVLDGLGATRRLVAEHGTSGVAIVILTTFDRDDYLFEALGAGASGFLLKNAPPEDLVAAVRTVAGGDALLAPAVTRRVIAEFAGVRRAPSEAVSPATPLTEREAEVLRHVAKGSSNAEIAAALFLGEATVKTHVSNVLVKIGVRDRVQAVVWAYENGFIRAANS
jgi:DNA-binding NarL/FixJ family response regulator